MMEMELKYFVLFLAIGSLLECNAEETVCRASFVCANEQNTIPSWNDMAINDLGGELEKMKDFLGDVSELKKCIISLSDDFEEGKTEILSTANSDESTYERNGKSFTAASSMKTTTVTEPHWSTFVETFKAYDMNILPPSSTSSSTFEVTAPDETTKGSVKTTTPIELPETAFAETYNVNVPSSTSSSMFEMTILDEISETTMTKEIVKAHCSESSGVTRIYPTAYQKNGGTLVYCDNATDGDGWTVFQRREDGSVNFIRNWADYVNGFGNLEGEYWMGLEKLHLLTSDDNYELRVDLEDWDGNRAYAQYSEFRVADSSNYYRLRVGGYSGTAGDSMKHINGQKFSASDRDNDKSSSTHCSRLYEGGWWFNDCHSAHLNGVYLHQKDGEMEYAQGIIWFHWKGFYYSLKFAEMKFRPVVS